MNVLSLFAALVLVPMAAWASAAAQSDPTFNGYASEALYQGESAPIDFSSSEAREFRTRLRRTEDMPVNFAGEYVLTTWGVGAGCVTGATVSKASGKVFFLPGAICDIGSSSDRMVYQANSRLLILNGYLNDQGPYGQHFYEITAAGFNHLLTRLD